MAKDAFTGSQKKTFRAGNKLGRHSIAELDKMTREGEYLKQYEKSYKYAKKELQPYYKEQQREFTQETAPQLLAGLGGGLRSSSALNQALAASLTNLNERMQARTNDLAAQLSENDLNRRYDAATFGAQIGQQNLSASPYLPSSGRPSVGRQLLGHGINAAATAAGAFFGGPAGAMAANQASQIATSRLTGGQNSGFGGDFMGQFMGGSPQYGRTNISSANQM